MALSCQHVFFSKDVVSYDFGKDPELGTSQPSWGDRSRSGYVGSVQRAKYNDTVDAAVVNLTEDSVARVMDLVLTGVGKPPEHALGELGAAVSKRGRSTEWTHGFIEDVDLTVVRKDNTSLLGQFSIVSNVTAFAGPGDSGSVIVTKGGQVLGLLVMATGGAMNSVVKAIATPIATVLSAMGVSLAYEGIGGFDLDSPADLGFAYDPHGTGRLDHLVFYRPGSARATVIAHEGENFPAVYRSGEGEGKSGIGIGGYPLTDGSDRAFAMDFPADPAKPGPSGNSIVLYRPGADIFVIMGTYNQGRDFECLLPHVADIWSFQPDGVGGYHLTSPLDRAFALDYRGKDHEEGRGGMPGRLDHVVLYRPGSNRFWILGRDGDDFTRVYPDPAQSPAPDQGIGGYQLTDENDQAFAFDFNGNGHADHIALYRPGGGRFWIVGKKYDAAGKAHYERVYPDPSFKSPSDEGLGEYPLTDPRDRAFPFDFAGTGYADHIAVYRPGAGVFWILAHRTDTEGRPYFARVFPNPKVLNPATDGLGPGQYNLAHPNDKAFAFDYTGTGKLDHVVLYRPGAKTCWIARLKKPNPGKPGEPPVFESVYEAWGTQGGYPGRKQSG